MQSYAEDQAFVLVEKQKLKVMMSEVYVLLIVLQNANPTRSFAQVKKIVTVAKQLKFVSQSIKILMVIFVLMTQLHTKALSFAMKK